METLSCILFLKVKRRTTQEMSPDLQLVSQSVRTRSTHQNKAHRLLRALTFFSGMLVAFSACFVASLNKSSTFSLSLAEHSKYSTALSFLLASSPC